VIPLLIVVLSAFPVGQEQFVMKKLIPVTSSHNAATATLILMSSVTTEQPMARRRVAVRQTVPYQQPEHPVQMVNSVTVTRLVTAMVTVRLETLLSAMTG
jgi:hypothetical protein